MYALPKIEHLKQACFSTFHACSCMEATFLYVIIIIYETLLPCMNHDWFRHREIKHASNMQETGIIYVHTIITCMWHVSMYWILELMVVPTHPRHHPWIRHCTPIWPWVEFHIIVGMHVIQKFTVLNHLGYAPACYVSLLCWPPLRLTPKS